ncbi:hypothetical protein EB796_006166 [Bugula neritina]|uniref:Uncharacterized protein n=1 Tax=Bugula neritina TaxID=10212 RepID=A0A7J7KBE5_BUGNE|nr:hypothetical protein EB796_006166 [Bugula neritina]
MHSIEISSHLFLDKDLPYKDTPMGKVYSDLIVYTQNDHAKFSELVPMKNLYEKRSLNPQYLLTQSGQLNDLAESAEAVEKPTAVKDKPDEEQSATEGKVRDSLASPGEGPSTSDTNKDN